MDCGIKAQALRPAIEFAGAESGCYPHQPLSTGRPTILGGSLFCRFKDFADSSTGG